MNRKQRQDEFDEKVKSILQESDTWLTPKEIAAELFCHPIKIGGSIKRLRGAGLELDWRYRGTQQVEWRVK